MSTKRWFFYWFLLSCVLLLPVCNGNNGIEPGNQTGSVQITTNPTGARVAIDGQDIDAQTPFTLDDLPVGWHTVELSLTDFQSWHDSVFVVSDSSVILSVELTALTGILSVTSNPPNAEIWLDGENTHLTTPSGISNVSIGDHGLTLTLDGYQTFSDYVYVSSSQTLQFHADLIALVGQLTITSAPSGALINLDGIATSQLTPHTFTDLLPGEHVVELKWISEDVFYWEGSVVVGGGQNPPLDVTLIPYGALSIASSPEGARIYLNGYSPYNETTPLITRFTVRPERYEIQLRLDGYETWSDSVTVLSGSITEVFPQLVPL